MSDHLQGAAGVSVLELSERLSGAFAGLILGAQGANVRQWRQGLNRRLDRYESAYFDRHRSPLPEGVKLATLLREADVILCDLDPATALTLGLRMDALSLRPGQVFFRLRDLNGTGWPPERLHDGKASRSGPPAGLATSPGVRCPTPMSSTTRQCSRQVGNPKCSVGWPRPLPRSSRAAFRRFRGPHHRRVPAGSTGCHAPRHRAAIRLEQPDPRLAVDAPDKHRHASALRGRACLYPDGRTAPLGRPRQSDGFSGSGRPNRGPKTPISGARTPKWSAP